MLFLGKGIPVYKETHRKKWIRGHSRLVVFKLPNAVPL